MSILGSFGTILQGMESALNRGTYNALPVEKGFTEEMIAFDEWRQNLTAVQNVSKYFLSNLLSDLIFSSMLSVFMRNTSDNIEKKWGAALKNVSIGSVESEELTQKIEGLRPALTLYKNHFHGVMAANWIRVGTVALAIIVDVGIILGSGALGISVAAIGGWAILGGLLSLAGFNLLLAWLDIETFAKKWDTLLTASIYLGVCTGIEGIAYAVLHLIYKIFVFDWDIQDYNSWIDRKVTQCFSEVETPNINNLTLTLV